MILRRFGTFPVAVLIRLPDFHPQFGCHVRRAVHAATGAHGEAGQHEGAIAHEARQAHLGEFAHTGEGKGRVLEAGQLRHAVLNLLHQVGHDLGAGRLRQVVDKQRQVGSSGHNAVMLDDGFIAGLVKEGRHTANGFAAGAGGVLGEAGRAGGGGGAHVHDVGDAALGLIRGDGGNTHVLVIVQQHAFARAACHPEAVHAGLNVVFHYFPKDLLVERPFRGHWGDNGREHPAKLRHVTSPSPDGSGAVCLGVKPSEQVCRGLHKTLAYRGTAGHYVRTVQLYTTTRSQRASSDEITNS